MRRVLAFAAVALAAVALYAAAAPAGQQAVTPRQFAALSKKVTALRKDVDTIGTVLANCVMYRAFPVKVYGGLSNEGYLYQFPDGITRLETAIDLAPESDTSAAWMLTVDPACASTINQGARRTLAKILRSTPTQARLKTVLRNASR